MPKSRYLHPLLALSLAATLTAPLRADEAAGAYLAARQAEFMGDYSAVARYGTRLLANDPENAKVMESVVVARIGLGDIEGAVPVARRLQGLAPGNQVAGLVLLGEAMLREDWDAVHQRMDEGLSVGGLMDGMVRAWAEIGQGHASQGLKSFATMAEDEGMVSFALYQRALALTTVGAFEGAAEIFADQTHSLPLTRRGVLAYVQSLNQLERSADAVAFLDFVYPGERDAGIEKIYAELSAGKPLEYDAIRGARDGLAEVFFSIADTLGRDADPGVVLLYSRMAEFLRPGDEPALLLSARLLEDLEQYALAVDTFDRIGRESPFYPAAMMGKSDALREWDRVDEAIVVLEALASDYPDNTTVLTALGDILRRQDAFEGAAAAYDKAIALYSEDMPEHWLIYFARGIANERLGAWDKAEADFRKALELNPGQPSVLNYLGYSFVELKQNLDEALAMIENAVAARPNDGYITDSLGWVYYRLGRYQEAVVQMELAVELMPVDPIINDHLGDVYWAVGRKREAVFQWRRAMSFEPEEEDLNRIRRKLEVGLDKVLEEEGADPLKRTDEEG